MAVLDIDLNRLPLLEDDGETVSQDRRSFMINNKSTLPLKKRVYSDVISCGAIILENNRVEKTKPKGRKPIIHISKLKRLNKKKNMKEVLSVPPKKRFVEDDRSPPRKRQKRVSVQPKTPPTVEELIPDYVRNNPEFENITDVGLVIEKLLEESDINRQQNRLSIPHNQILRGYVTESESNWLQREITKSKSSSKTVKTHKLGVKVIGSGTKLVHDMALSRWNYKTSGFRYSLIDNWYEFMEENKLKMEDLVRVVSFRCQNKLCLAVLKLDNMASSS